MREYLNTLLLLPVWLIIREDFQRRQVGVVWLCLLGGSSLTIACIGFGARNALISLGSNMTLLLLLCGGLLLWLHMRGRRIRDIFSLYFGLGDVVFMAAVTPLFDTRGYVWFLLISCVTALFGFVLFRWKTIPLAGIMGIVLVSLALCKIFEVWN